MLDILQITFEGPTRCSQATIVRVPLSIWNLRTNQEIHDAFNRNLWTSGPLAGLQWAPSTHIETVITVFIASGLHLFSHNLAPWSRVDTRAGRDVSYKPSAAFKPTSTLNSTARSELLEISSNIFDSRYLETTSMGETSHQIHCRGQTVPHPSSRREREGKTHIFLMFEQKHCIPYYPFQTAS